MVYFSTYSTHILHYLQFPKQKYIPEEGLWWHGVSKSETVPNANECVQEPLPFAHLKCSSISNSLNSVCTDSEERTINNAYSRMECGEYVRSTVAYMVLIIGNLSCRLSNRKALGPQTSGKQIEQFYATVEISSHPSTLGFLVVLEHRRFHFLCFVSPLNESVIIHL